MKGLALAAVVAAFLARAGAGYGGNAFHNGGTGDCTGCHGRSGNTKTFSNNSSSSGFMLRGSDPSSTCLICHGATKGTRQPKEYYIATSEADMPRGVPPLQLTPGGDFGWLKKNYGAAGGAGNGHNIMAADYDFTETNNLLAPGGTYPASGLSCISCHDPHGNYRRNADGTISSSGLPIVASGSYSSSPNPDDKGAVGTYRLLAGKGYRPGYLPGAVPFTADPPAAVAPADYNRSESATDTRVAYGSGMSEWCMNCHVVPHGDSVGHPAGNSVQMPSEVVDSYNSYALGGGSLVTVENAYTSMVPFEMGTNDYAILKATANSDGSKRTGAKRNSNVMCLTCHRAHASGWDHMTRWNMKAQYLVVNGGYPDADDDASAQYALGRSSEEIRKSFYDRPASAFRAQQKSLCNKCHPKD